MKNINIELIEKDIKKLIEEIEETYLDKKFNIRDGFRYFALADFLPDPYVNNFFQELEQDDGNTEFDMDENTGYFRLIAENSLIAVYFLMYDEDGEWTETERLADSIKIIDLDFQYDLTHLNEDEEEEEEI